MSANKSLSGRILLVDDQSANVRVVTALLERHGYVVTAASSGKDAVSAGTLATSLVTGVTQGSDGVKLSLASGASVDRDDIKGVFRP